MTRTDPYSWTGATTYSRAFARNYSIKITVQGDCDGIPYLKCCTATERDCQAQHPAGMSVSFESKVPWFEKSTKILGCLVAASILRASRRRSWRRLT